MAQNSTEWRPKPRQKKILEEAQEAGLHRSVTVICEEAGIPRRTFYNWLKDDPEFADAWESIWRCAISKHLPGVIAAQIKKALTGDTAAARLLADLAGVIRQHHEIETPGEIVIKLAWDDADRGDNASEAA